MKKTYIAPAIEQIKVETEGFLASSTFEVVLEEKEEQGVFSNEYDFNVDIWGLDEEE